MRRLSSLLITLSILTIPTVVTALTAAPCPGGNCFR